MKASKLPSAAARHLIDHMEFDPIRDSAPIPFLFEEWRRIIRRYDLPDLCGFQGWAPAIKLLNSHLITTPRELSLLRRSEILLTAAESPD